MLSVINVDITKKIGGYVENKMGGENFVICYKLNM